MKISLFESFSRKKREFKPINSDNVRIYACGPTVYDYAHVGNARMAVVTDLLVKTLKCSYKKVTYVSNITDIDDKHIAAAANIGDISIPKRGNRIPAAIGTPAPL